jgi:hypothetical protein
MYNVEDATFEEFDLLCNNSFENSIASKECYDGYVFKKLTFDGVPLVVTGVVPIYDKRTEQNELYMCVSVSKDIVHHKRALLIVGKDYINFMCKNEPLCVIIEHENNIFSKFAKHFGFERTNFVEKNVESGIIYDVYIRR